MAKQKTVWIAKDGTQFDTEGAADTWDALHQWCDDYAKDDAALYPSSAYQAIPAMDFVTWAHAHRERVEHLLGLLTRVDEEGIKL